MTIEEAIKAIELNRPTSGYTILCEALDMAVAALREQEERENVWHDAKDNPPQKYGLYYGKNDDTDSMYLCQYRDGVWTMDAYPETRMHVIKWAYYNAFAQEQEEMRWIPVTERLPDEHESLFSHYKGTNKWCDGMFMTISDLVIVCADYENGERIVKTANTTEGIWKVKDSFYPCRVTHWMPLPESPVEDEK